ncbi:hypothetical protein [Candidatus Nitrosocosmicus hydrocola]|uniref:hypothetical protein n=1 Tax=Candidatus Nitrosocosmicus hydrocola TaxID=1826872 RepID=UPI0013724052|nr:hypothetical protein [Candidatus Nitrosocosmicus hydrocola]
MNSRTIVSKSTGYLVIAAVIAGLLSLSPMTYAQNSTNTSEIKDLYNQAKNTSMDLVNQAPGVLKGAYNQAKNTSMDLVNQAVTLIKNDTNSSKLLAQLESDFGNLVNEFSNFLSR